MRARIAVALGLLAFGLGGMVAASVMASRSTSVGETSCTQLVHDYVQTAARISQVAVTREHLLACRQDGNQAVARVQLTLKEPVYDPFTGRVSESVRGIVLVLRFYKSPWATVEAKVVGG